MINTESREGARFNIRGRAALVLAALLPLLLLGLTAAAMQAAAAAHGAPPAAGAGGQDVHLPVIVHPFGPVTFTHGVASGDVVSDSALLWTRTSGPANLTVDVATDPSFASIVSQGSASTGADTDYTALLPVGGLSPGQEYFYRWRQHFSTSPAGSFKTPPDTSGMVRLVFSGDSDGTPVGGGLPYFNNFEALDAARMEDADFFVYLGDTVYSDSGQRTTGPAITLDEYRETYRWNREVAALPDLLAATSSLVIWDDHEVKNDYAGLWVDPDRYSNGRQAFLEYMPIRTDNLPADPGCEGDPLFRVFHWGPDVDIVILDERSCRSISAIDSCIMGFPFPAQPDPAPQAPLGLRLQFGLPPFPPAGCIDAINDSSRTMLGAVQKQLFLDFLANSTATYKLVINEVAIMQFYAFPYDRWEGYGAERDEILNYIRDNNIPNVVFLTADAHTNLINEVFIDIGADSETIAYEFVTGPIGTGTMQANVFALLGQDGVDALNAAFTAVGVDCRHLDAYSYGLVEVDGPAGTLTVTLKDDTGTLILDQIDGTTPCTLTLGP